MLGNAVRIQTIMCKYLGGRASVYLFIGKPENLHAGWTKLRERFGDRAP